MVDVVGPRPGGEMHPTVKVWVEMLGTVTGALWMVSPVMPNPGKSPSIWLKSVMVLLNLQKLFRAVATVSVVVSGCWAIGSGSDRALTMVGAVLSSVRLNC